MVNVRQLQRSADYHHTVADTTEDAQLAQTHRDVALQLEELVQAALTHNAQLEQFQPR